MVAKKLRIGDTIGLISPASPEEKNKIENGINFLESQGFKVKVGKYVYDRWGYLAGKDEDRAEDLMNMFLDKDVDMILCVRGGYGSMRLLPLLDYKAISKNPKIFMGYSDITTFLNIFASKCGLITFHGPMGSSNFGDTETLQSFINTLTSCTKPYTLSNSSRLALNCENKGSVQGKIVGGNLSLIASTIGTPYEINTKGNILFIEEVDEKPYAIDRMLTQLYLSGKLKECKGFILGQFTDCSMENYHKSLTLQEVIEDKILALNKPTLSNFMTGHDYPKLTLPIGARAKIDTYKGTIEILEKVVE